MTTWFEGLLLKNTEDEIYDKFERLTTQENEVILMTIHKSKGLEFDTVLFVDYDIDVKTEALK